jgi:1-acyl-sn-glycerol-3-phosphate acyltransferase
VADGRLPVTVLTAAQFSRFRNVSGDAWGILVIVAYVAAAAGVVLFQMQHWSEGRHAWLLHVLLRTYVSFMFRVRLPTHPVVPAQGGALLFANHCSPVDPFILLACARTHDRRCRTRPIEFLAAAEYCELRGFLGWVTRTARSIPLRRGRLEAAPLREALHRLKGGRMVGVFPEGRINRTSQLLKGKNGLAWLALRGNVPVIAVHLRGVPVRGDLVSPFVTPTRVRVRFGSLIEVGQFQNQRLTSRLLEEFTESFMTHLAELQARDSV